MASAGSRHGRHSAARLWRWAGQRLQGEVWSDAAHVHTDTATFIDAIQTSSNVLAVIFPLVKQMVRLRHSFRGTVMPSELQQTRLLANWNSADDFLEGSAFAHQTLLESLWRRPGEPLPCMIRDSLGLDARNWLEDARSHAMAEAAVERTQLVALSTRFERLDGPKSLEYIRGMDLSDLRSFSRDDERVSAFHYDTWEGASLELEVAAVSEAVRFSLPRSADCETSDGTPDKAAVRTIVRRADKLVLTCDFNLRDGIASPFRIARVEPVLAEAKTQTGASLIMDGDTAEVNR